MKHIGEDARFWMSCLHRYSNALAESIQVFRKTPKLELWHDPELVANLQQRAIALHRFAELQAGLVRGSGRRRRKTASTKFRNHTHFSLGALHSFSSALIIINDPFRKADRALERKSGIGDPPL